MTTFSYTTGNPSNLTGGTTAAMNDIQGPFTDLRTFLNGANLDTTNLATSAKPVTLLGVYKNEAHGFMRLDGQGASTYFPNWSGTPVAITGTSGAALQLFSFTASEYAVSGLTPQMRLRVNWAVNGTAPGVSFSFQVFDVTAFSTAADAIGVQTASGLGTSAVVTTPGSGTRGTALSADFTVPSSVSCAVGVAPTGSMAASSMVVINYDLQVHWV